MLTKSLIAAPFRRYVKEKPLKRVLIDTFLLWIVSQLTPNQLRGMLGSTQDMYNTFVEERNLPNIVEELGNDSRLLWVGPRYTEQIILYFHGICQFCGYKKTTVLI